MSKLSNELVAQALDAILAFASGADPEGVAGTTKKGRGPTKRKFRETVELQIGLKNYDPAKDKRFNGTVELPFQARPELKVCVLGTAQDVARARDAGLEFMTEDDMKKTNKNKKVVKKIAKQYDAFLASQKLVKKVPRMMGPGLNKAGKFPSILKPTDDLLGRVATLRASVKFQMKKVLCLNAVMGHVQMPKEELHRNVVTAVNFLVSLLKKGWQNVAVLYLKSSMGPVQQIYF